VVEIRPACPADLSVVQQIEFAAGELFRGIGMSDIADHPEPTLEVLAGYHRAGHAWVAVDGSDRPIAFILVMLIDEQTHIEQVSVHPDHAHRRIGRQLIDHVAGWAADQGMSALTLTTFRDVPWNGPYYERLGFTEVTGPERGPELVALMAVEAAHGLDPAQRIAMRRPIHRSR
jgi:GNAT superfamily N-acetyltransferase